MDNKVLLQDLAQGLSARASMQKKDADAFVRNVFDIIIQFLQEDKIVKIKGLGTFKVIEVSGRDSVNVNTGERIHIGGHSKISFTPDSALKDQVNRPFADFETIIINEGVDLSEMERIPDANDVLSSEDVLGVDNADELPDNSSVVEVDAPVEDIPLPTPVDEVTAEDTPAVVALATPVDEVIAEDTPTVVPLATPVDEVIAEDTPTVVPLAMPVDEVTAEDTPTVVPLADVAQDDSIATEAPAEPTPSVDGSTLSAGDDESSSNDSSDDVLESDIEDVYATKHKFEWGRFFLYLLLALLLLTLGYLAGRFHWFDKINSYVDGFFKTEQTEKPVTVDSISKKKDTKVVPVAVDSLVTNDSLASNNSLPVNEDPAVSEGEAVKPATKGTAVSEGGAVKPATKGTAVSEGGAVKPATKGTAVSEGGAVKPATKGTAVSEGGAVKSAKTGTAVSEGGAVKPVAKKAVVRKEVDEFEEEFDRAQTMGRTASSRGVNSKNALPDGRYQIAGTKCTHVLKSGEGLYQLSRLYYGNQNMVTYIISYNHLPDPDLIPVGTVLKIPELKSVE